MAGTDPRDLRQPARTGDRRTEPRRIEDRILHYARERVIGAACIAADAMTGTDVSDEVATETVVRLTEAVADYRSAEAAASQAREDHQNVRSP